MIDLSGGTMLNPGLNIIKTVLPRACVPVRLMMSIQLCLLHKAFVDDESPPAFAFSAAP